MVHGLFEYGNFRVDVKANGIYRFKSLPWRRATTTRVLVVGEVGQRLYLSCEIAYKAGRNNQCSNDYFYVVYNKDAQIRGAEYYCGRSKSIKKQSKTTTKRPVIGVATSATSASSRNRYGKYKCIVRSVPVSGAVLPSGSTTTPSSNTSSKPSTEETDEPEEGAEPDSTDAPEEPASSDAPAAEAPADE